MLSIWPVFLFILQSFRLQYGKFDRMVSTIQLAWKMCARKFCSRSLSPVMTLPHHLFCHFRYNVCVQFWNFEITIALLSQFQPLFICVKNHFSEFSKKTMNMVFCLFWQYAWVQFNECNVNILQKSTVDQIYISIYTMHYILMSRIEWIQKKKKHTVRC